MASPNRAAYKSETFRQNLLKQILSGKLKAGDRIAGCRELSSQYNLSYVTVNKVINDLRKKGLLSVTPGRGIFVKSSRNIVKRVNKAYSHPRKALLYEPVISEDVWNSFLQSSPSFTSNIVLPQFVKSYRELLSPETLNSQPDFIYTSDDLVPTMAKRKILRPLNDILDAYGFDLGRYPARLIDIMSYNGEVYALPVCFSTHVVFYNKDIFDECGIEYPPETWTWKNFLDTARKLTVLNNEGKSRFGLAPYFDKAMTMNFFLQGFEGDISVEKALASHMRPEGIHFIFDMVNKHRVSPVPPNDRSIITDLLLSGNAAMSIAKFSLMEYLEKSSFRWGVVRLPSGRRNVSPCAVQGIGISRALREVSQSVNVFRELTGGKMQQMIYESFAGLPACLDLLKRGPEVNIFTSQLDHVQNIYLNFTENEDRINALLYRMFIGTLEPEKMLSEFRKMYKDAGKRPR